MTRAALHATYERVLARALRTDDPVASVRTAAAEPGCPPALRRTLMAVCAHEAGLRMSALITTRLRFERLLNGSPRAAQCFADDPERFAQLFRAYHQAVAPTAHGPRAEAELFDVWVAHT